MLGFERLGRAADPVSHRAVRGSARGEALTSPGSRAPAQSRPAGRLVRRARVGTALPPARARGAEPRSSARRSARRRSTLEYGFLAETDDEDARARLERGDRCFIAREARHDRLVPLDRRRDGRTSSTSTRWLDLEPDEVFLSETLHGARAERPRGVRRGGHAARARARGGRLPPYPRRRAAWRTTPASARTRRRATGAVGRIGYVGFGPLRKELQELVGRLPGHGHDRQGAARASSGRTSATASSSSRSATVASARPSPMPQSTSPYYRDVFRRGDIDPREIHGADDLARLPVVSREEVRADPGDSAPRDPRCPGWPDAPVVGDDRACRSSSTTIPARCSSTSRTVSASARPRLPSPASGCAIPVSSSAPTSQENVDRVRGFMAETSFRPLRPRYVRGIADGCAARGCVRADRPRATRHPARLRLAHGDVLQDRRRAWRAEAPAEGVAVHVGSHVARWPAADRGDVRHPRHLEVQRDGGAQGRRGLRRAERLPPARGTSATLRSSIEKARLLADGEPGEILLSNLVNRGSVLLNYRIGDLGRISTSMLQLRPEHARARGSRGQNKRIRDACRRNDRRAATSSPRPSSAFAGVVRFQLVQVSPTSFELRLVTVDRKAFDDGAAAAATDAVRRDPRGL